MPKKRRKIKATQLLTNARKNLSSSGGYIDSKGGYGYFQEMLNKVTRELIHPRLNTTDDNYIYDKFIRRLRRYSNKVTSNTLPEDIVEQHIVHDLFSLHYNKNKDMKILSHNPVKKKLLTTVVDQMSKIITEEDYLNSFFYTYEIGNYIYNLLAEMKPEERKKVMASLGGDSSKDDDAEKILSKHLGKTKQKLKKAQQKAKKSANNSEKFSEGKGNELKDIEFVDDVENIIERLKAINISHTKVNKFFKKILNESTNYFNKITKYQEENLFEADEIEEILDLQNLIKPLDQIHLHDLTNRRKMSKGKVDIYIDVSGSMGSSIHKDNRIVIAKAFAIKLMKMGYANNVYFFSTRLSESYDNYIKVLMYSDGGGTDFSVVTDKCSLTQSNSIVITDGEDDISHYLPKVFWVGIGGTKFDYFHHNEDGKKYVKNKQCIYFDGSDFKYTTEEDAKNASRSYW